MPGLLVEINRKEPTRFVKQKGIDTNGLLPEQMVSDHCIGQRKVFALLMIWSFESVVWLALCGR